MPKRYQVTLYDKQNRYKPVSAIVMCSAPKDLTDKADRKWLISQGTMKICQKRLWGARELKQYGYLTAKIRDYDEFLAEMADFEVRR